MIPRERQFWIVAVIIAACWVACGMCARANSQADPQEYFREADVFVPRIAIDSLALVRAGWVHLSPSAADSVSEPASVVTVILRRGQTLIVSRDER